MDKVQSNQPDWSVAYNPKLTQALHIDLVKTLNFTARVNCLKFSPDGRYLAVGLSSGRTTIYDVEKRLNIWYSFLVAYKLRALSNVLC
jgi:WD40 repeat protein